MVSYSKKPRSVAEYTMMRGVTDYSNAAQFNMFETGYSFLTVISRPAYLEKLAETDAEVKKLLDLFCYILEYEFRGLDGIDDINVEELEFTDGISQVHTVGKVTQQSATEVSMTFTEKSGTVLTKFIDYFLRGVKDPRTQAKTYHGLIKAGKMAGGFENEVFNLLYIVTDNTLVGLEKAYLLVNAYPNKVPSNIFNSQKGEIDKKEIDITMKCFVIDGEEVNKRALKMLAFINEDGAVANAATVNGSNKEAAAIAKDIKSYTDNQVHLDSGEFQYKGLESVEQVYKSAGNLNT